MGTPRGGRGRVGLQARTSPQVSLGSLFPTGLFFFLFFFPAGLSWLLFHVLFPHWKGRRPIREWEGEQPKTSRRVESAKWVVSPEPPRVICIGVLPAHIGTCGLRPMTILIPAEACRGLGGSCAEGSALGVRLT